MPLGGGVNSFQDAPALAPRMLPVNEAPSFAPAPAPYQAPLGVSQGLAPLGAAPMQPPALGSAAAAFGMNRAATAAPPRLPAFAGNTPAANSLLARYRSEGDRGRASLARPGVLARPGGGAAGTTEL